MVESVTIRARNEFRRTQKETGNIDPEGLGLDKNDPYAWSHAQLAKPFLKTIFDPWIESIKTPFTGVTSDGTKINDLYTLADEEAPVAEMVSAANHLLHLLTAQEKSKAVHGLDSEQWRKWSNPEIIFFPDCGLRLDLDSVPLRTIEAILDLLRASLSKKGFEKCYAALLLNEFLGQETSIPKILNRWSYFFMLFGEPSETKPWGFTWHGHHLCINVFVVGHQMVIGPCFIGAEPNVIDVGPYKGTVVCHEEEELGLSLIDSLSPEILKQAIICSSMSGDALPAERWNPADQHHLAGAYQDNRIIPYEGVNISAFTPEQRENLWSVVETFLEFYPEAPLKYRMAQIKSHASNTYFAWIGGHGPDDAFYFKIQSPVVLLEFDHHNGLAIPTDKPVKHHIHTTQRLPNGNDYARELIWLWKEGEN